MDEIMTRKWPITAMSHGPVPAVFTVVLGLVFCAPAAGPQGRLMCGVQRWPVKIWADDDAATVQRDSVRAASIPALRALLRPSGPFPHRGRIGPEERTVYRVRAQLAQVLAESDGDFHLLLRDSVDASATLVAEIPDSACAVGTGHEAQYAEVRRTLRQLPRQAMVEVEGIGFFDTLHGQRGMAPNGFELHPVLQLRPYPAPSDSIK
jgi:hypothetical protein